MMLTVVAIAIKRVEKGGGEGRGGREGGGGRGDFNHDVNLYGINVNKLEKEFFFLEEIWSALNGLGIQKHLGSLKVAYLKSII